MALKTRYSPLQNFSLDNVLMAFVELPLVQKVIALIFVLLLLILILFLPMSLLSGKVGSLRKDISSAQKNYRQVSDKISEYQKAKSDIDRIEAKFGQGGGPLTTRVSSVASQIGLNVEQVKEKGNTETDFLEVKGLEVKISNATLSQVMELIYDLENDKASPMQVRRLQMKPKNNNRQILDVSFEVATFSLKKEP